MTQSASPDVSSVTRQNEVISAMTKTTLDFTATQTAFDQGRLAHQTGNYEQAIIHYTQALKTLQENVSSAIFMHRAAAYQMKKQCKLAAEDINLATSVPTYPAESYLTLGNALVSRGDLCKAQEIYREGIKSVQYPQNETLFRNYEEVTSLMKKQNEHLVEKLPFEVISRILSRLSIKERARLGMTCRFWNDYIFHNWPHMWHAVDNKKNTRSYRERNAGLAKAIRGEQVRELSLEFLDPDISYLYNDYGTYDSDSENQYDGLLFHGGTAHQAIGILNAMSTFPERWAHVESLSLRYCRKAHFKRLLPVVKKSLKALTLYDTTLNAQYRKTILRYAAESSNNLQVMTNYLKHEDHDIDTLFEYMLDYVESATQFSNFHITSLWISFFIDASEVAQICQKLPLLISLTIDNQNCCGNEGRLLEIVHSYLPLLKEFRYYSSSYRSGTAMCVTYTQSPSYASGLSTLVFRSNHEEKMGDNNVHLATIFQKSHETLQTLDLKLDSFEVGDYNALKTLAELGAPCLHTLILHSSAQDYSPGLRLISALISACPSLVTVQLAGSYVWQKQTFEALSVPKGIRQLTMGRYYGHGNTSPTEVDERASFDDMMQFFEHAQSLTEFSLYNLDMIPNAPADTITMLTQAIGFSGLRSLDLLASYISKSEMLLGIAENLKDSQIRTLKIRVKCDVDDAELDALAKIQHLTHLIVYSYDDHFGEDELCNLLERWQRPQMLVVSIQHKSDKKIISGCKPSTSATRQAKDMIQDPKVRYSIQRLPMESKAYYADER